MADPTATSVVAALESQRAVLSLMIERLRFVATQLPGGESDRWSGIANAWYELRRDELAATLRTAVEALESARRETDRAIATLGTRVG